MKKEQTMKKALILAIAIVAVLALVGCSGDPDPIGDSSSSGGGDPSSSSVGDDPSSSSVGDDPSSSSVGGDPSSSSVGDNYDPLPYGTLYATPYKPQMILGSCWLFASNAVLETHIKKTTGVQVSLSENHAKVGIFASRLGMTDRTAMGGNAVMAGTYWMRGELGGPVLTQDDRPYNTDINSTDWNPNAPRYGRVTNMQWVLDPTLEFPRDNPGYDLEFRNNIKEAIYNYGSVGGSYWSSGQPKHDSPRGFTYYFNNPDETSESNSNSRTDHAIQILGWDDNFPAGNFSNPPPGNGAWYVKDSKSNGVSFHWISYYQFFSPIFFVAGFEPQPVGNVYDYTPQATNWSYTNGTAGATRYWSNIFDCTDENANLEEVIIYASTGSTYRIYVATDEITQDAVGDIALLNSAFINKVAELTVNSSEPVNKYNGFYTLKLSSSIPIGNKSFAIVIEGTPLSQTQQRVYHLRTSYNENFRSAPRESYYSTSGVNVQNKTWTDYHSNRIADNTHGNFYIYAVVSGSNGQSDKGRVFK